MHIKQIVKKYLPKRLAEPLRKVWHDINFASGRYDVVSVLSYCAKTGAEYKVIDMCRKTSVVGPHYYGGPVPERQDQVPMPDTYVAEIRNTSIIGASNLNIVGGEALYNAPIGRNYSYTDFALFLEPRPPYQIGPGTKVYWRRNKTKRIDCAVSLICNFSFNYYHYVFECLPKLLLLEKSDIPSTVPILVDASIRDTPQFLTYLKNLNGERPIIWVEKRERIFVERLYLLSPVDIVPPELKDIFQCHPVDNLFDMNYIKQIRTRMMDFSSLSAETDAPRKIFISRKNQTARTYNEKEIFTVVQKYGFTAIAPETMTITEQIHAFSSADWIVAASGAALTNIIYCHPGCRILVLSNLNINISIFTSIAEALGIKMMYMAGDALDTKNPHTSFYINPKSLSLCLNDERSVS